MSENNDGGLAERGGGGLAQPGGPNTAGGGGGMGSRSGTGLGVNSPAGGGIGIGGTGRAIANYAAAVAPSPLVPMKPWNFTSTTGMLANNLGPPSTNTQSYSMFDAPWNSGSGVAAGSGYGSPTSPSGGPSAPQMGSGGGGGWGSGHMNAGQWADGGTIEGFRPGQPGQSGWVGERGPEWAQSLPGGGVHITPNEQLGRPAPQPPHGGWNDGWADGGVIQPAQGSPPGTTMEAIMRLLGFGPNAGPYYDMAPNPAPPAPAGARFGPPSDNVETYENLPEDQPKQQQPQQGGNGLMGLIGGPAMGMNGAMGQMGLLGMMGGAPMGLAPQAAMGSSVLTPDLIKKAVSMIFGGK